MYYIKKSFFLITISSIFFSLIYNYFYINTNITENSRAIKFVVLLFIFLYALFNGKFFRRAFEEIGDGAEYSFFHIISIILMISLIYILSFFVEKEIMNWLFSFPAVFGFIFSKLSYLVSLLCFGALNIIIMIIVTIKP